MGETIITGEWKIIHRLLNCKMPKLKWPEIEKKNNKENNGWIVRKW